MSVLPGRHPLVRQNLSEIVYERVLDLILAGQLAPGEEFREEDISTWLDVSRAPIREAAARLQANGFIVQRSGGSMRVVQGGEQETIAIELVSIAIATTAVQLMPLPLSADARAALTAAVTAYRERGSAVSAADFMAVLVGVHDVVVESAGISHLTDTYRERYSARVLAASVQLPQRHLNDAEDFDLYIDGLYASLVSGDRSAALMHLDGFRDALGTHYWTDVAPNLPHLEGDTT